MEETNGTRTLSDGNRLPLLGLGVWQVPSGPECANAVTWALELGYRHIDTAQAYGNEESVGEGLRESGREHDARHVLARRVVANPQPRIAEDALEVAVVEREEHPRLGTRGRHQRRIRIDLTNTRRRRFEERLHLHDRLIFAPSSLVDCARDGQRAHSLQKESR